MFNFYAEISGAQSVANSLLKTLAALTRLSRDQVRIFAADEGWSSWGS